MAKETGRGWATRVALLRLHLSAGETVECLVDTGFTGALMLPQAIVTMLNLPIVGREVFEMVGGRQFIASVALTDIEWPGERRTVSVIVSEDTLCSAQSCWRGRGSQLIIEHTLSVSHEES